MVEPLEAGESGFSNDSASSAHGILVMKKCSKCKIEKSLTEFHRDMNSHSGLTSQCKVCRYEYLKGYRKSDDGRKIVAEVSARHHQKVKHTPKYTAAQRKHFAKWVDKTPRYILSITLRHALGRRPSENPITIDGLMALWRAQDGKCAVSGVQMTWNRGALMPTSISIDRIEPALGYSFGNIRLVCYQVNTFRGRWSDEQMLTMARAIIAKADAESAWPTAGIRPAFARALADIRSS